jgi:hypothetical protein
MLIEAAEDHAPMLFARMALLRASEGGTEQVLNSSRKYTHGGRRNVARDQ